MSEQLVWVGIVAIVVLVTAPANWAVRFLLELIRVVDGGPSDGAGRWIGTLERLLIFLLVVGDEAGAAALVVAAKAILRFPEITGDEPHLEAEYVLVGSLASWLVAVAAGLGAKALLGLR